MCTALVALALTAAGTAANTVGANKAKKAQDGAREAERIRQKAFQDQADARAAENFSKTNKASTDAGMIKAEEGRKAASDAAVAEVTAPVAPVGSNLAGDGSAARLVAGETATQAAKGLGYAIQQGAAKAKLASFNDVGLENAFLNARTNQDIARIANFAKGSSDVLPLELEAASRKGQGLRTVGSILSTAGTLAGIGTGAGWFKTPPSPELGTALIGEPGVISSAVGPEPGKMLNLTGADLSKHTISSGNGLGPFDLSVFGRRPLFAPSMGSLAPANLFLPRK